MQPVDKTRETPMDRLKRLRAAQLTKQFAKDTLGAAQKRLAEERERAQRIAAERAAAERSRRSPSPRLQAPSACAADAAVAMLLRWRHCVGWVV